jgi:hypothetical protein
MDMAAMLPGRIVSKFTRSSALLGALVLGAASFVVGNAHAAGPVFQSFTYAAAPVLENPGVESQACLDLGIPHCPLDHICTIFGYSGNGVAKPSLGKTNIEVCILEDANLGIPASGGICSASQGSAQITYQIKPHSQKVLTFPLLGTSCEYNGAAIADLVQNMSIAATQVAGTLSISSLITQGSDATLSIAGTLNLPK